MGFSIGGKMSEIKCNCIGLLRGGKWDKTNEQNCRVYDADGLSPTICTMGGGNQEPKVLEPCIGAIRGRNPDNPSDRTAGVPTQQRLEINQSGVSNTLTTVQKDNVVVIPQATKQGYIECEMGGVADLSYPSSKTRRGRVQENGTICPTLMAGQQDVCYIEPNKINICGEEIETNGPMALDEQNKYVRKDFCVGTLTTDGSSPKHNNRIIQTDFRIRKLTPLECWRLMGFDDADHKRAENSGVSNSQRYKQAGNSIVVNVLEAIFRKMV